MIALLSLALVSVSTLGGDALSGAPLDDMCSQAEMSPASSLLQGSTHHGRQAGRQLPHEWFHKHHPQHGQHEAPCNGNGRGLASNFAATSDGRSAGCHPICTWSCVHTPCEQVCRPDCELPQCQVRCKATAQFD